MLCKVSSINFKSVKGINSLFSFFPLMAYMISTVHHVFVALSAPCELYVHITCVSVGLSKGVLLQDGGYSWI